MPDTGYIYGFFDRNDIVFYIGQTKNFRNRMYQHSAEVKRGNKLFCYNKLRKEVHETGRSGIKTFMKVIEDNIPLESLDSREIFHISRLKKNGYNLTNLTGGGRGGTHFPEYIFKQATSKRIGQKRSDETKRRMSEARMGIVFSAEHIRNLCIARRKRITSDDTRRKLSLAFRGKINIGKFRMIDPDGSVFITQNGLSDFCRSHNIDPSLMCMVAKGKRKHHKGWRAEKITENTSGTN